jgi:hypothetical protein
MSSSGVRKPDIQVADATTQAPPVAEDGPASQSVGIVAEGEAGKRRPRSLSGWRVAASLAASLFTLLVALALAVPPLAALLGLGWALYLALSALWGLAPSIVTGHVLTSAQTPVYLHALDAGGRIGFVAIGYLALVFSLMTLMAGLFGRRWGRLFVAPGALFVVTALALLGLAVVQAAQFASAIPLPVSWLAALGVYALLDAVMVSGVLVDARLTRSPTATGQHRAARKAHRRPQSAEQDRPVEPVDARPAL